MGDKKIEILKNKIASQIINEFNNQIDEVLSICESEIEKLMLLHFYSYFIKFKENDYWLNRYNEIEFIDEEIYLDYPDNSREENIRLHNRVSKYKHRHVGQGVYHKYIGFKMKDDRMESISVDTMDNTEIPGSDLVYREFEIRPQYSVTVDGIEYRIDIAIIMNRRDLLSNNIIETRKIALECDGYDYHSSPEQKRNDDIRTRKLKKTGWKEVLRYSGKELHSIKSKNEIHSLFNEIIEVLYI